MLVMSKLRLAHSKDDISQALSIVAEIRQLLL
jgi:hypothetical protein